MTPGDVVLYESHSVLHGRPFPLRGKYFANIFVHFKPLFDGEGGEGVGGETEVTENMDEL
jgi:prolyl 4-hydroxylase